MLSIAIWSYPAQQYCRLPETRSFNLDKNNWTRDCKFFEDEPEIKAKWRKCSEMYICRISEYGRRNFRTNPQTIVADASHNTNQNRFQGWAHYLSKSACVSKISDQEWTTSTEIDVEQNLSNRFRNTKSTGRVITWSYLKVCHWCHFISNLLS